VAGWLIIGFFYILWLFAKGIESDMFSSPRRWWRTTLLWLGIIALLHGDFLVGYLVEYLPAVHKAGNGEVLKRVTADGFLEGAGSYFPEEPGVVLFQKNYPFSYVEVRALRTRKSGLVDLRGNTKNGRFPDYVHFFRALASAPECEAFNALPDAIVLRKKFKIPDSECIVAKLTWQPISRYEVTTLATRKLHPNSPFNVTVWDRLLIDRESGETIVRCSSVAIEPQISRIIWIQLLHAYHDPPCFEGRKFFSLIRKAVIPAGDFVSGLSNPGNEDVAVHAGVP
jgi:hypothetical protein